jgi:hypothetical protein
MFAAEQLKNMHGREKELVILDAEGLHVHSCIAPTLVKATPPDPES